MKIGILGSGPVGTTLASGFTQHGHEAMISARDPGKLVGWQAENPSGKVGSFAEAIKFGDALVLAVKAEATSEVLRSAGVEHLAGKVVMDATNPITNEPPVNGVLRFYTTMDDSLMERLQREFPRARFVKAFSCVGNEFMVNPKLRGGMPTMFICGNDDGAKQVVTGILDQFGWETADMGKVESARAIEPLCILWCLPGFLRNEWSHAFKLLHK
ncbi:MAG: NAD(P)-binding domain-containing protein [Candidatus Eisenbacteria bacterium]|uniref:NAD(P)-binding domain-containing protein n=1 Tax=Eiseniibacteriota bacterium TaxID=2212470 RepID=A0A849SGN8_UNCEI|nr:NAD(P)-binding domain-containing protein [Candidatus Eisenbacteria bacterium]